MKTTGVPHGAVLRSGPQKYRWSQYGKENEKTRMDQK
jgi:hypothetical protein